MVTEDFERLYNEHAAALLAFLEYRTGNIELAKDIHADTFERVLKTRWRFDPRKASQKTWLYSIALNVLRDQGRRRGAEARALERIAAGPSPDEGQAGTDHIVTRDALRVALERLPVDEREAVALRYGADLSLKEIAEITGTRTTTVKGRLFRALEKLRESVAW